MEKVTFDDLYPTKEVQKVQGFLRFFELFLALIIPQISHEY